MAQADHFQARTALGPVNPAVNRNRLDYGQFFPSKTDIVVLLILTVA